MSQLGKELIPRQTIEQMVLAYEQGMIEIKQGIEQIHLGEARLHAAFGAFNQYTNFTACTSWVRDLEKTMLSGAWKGIIDQSGIRKYMSEKRLKEIDEKLHSGTMPPLTVDEVYALLMAMQQNAPAIQDEMIKEVYSFIHPHWHENAKYRYKTNKRYEIGKKAILSWYMVDYDSYNRYFRVNYEKRDRLNHLERVFLLLDGKPMPDRAYQSCLVDGIHTAGPSGKPRPSISKSRLTETAIYILHSNGWIY